VVFAEALAFLRAHLGGAGAEPGSTVRVHVGGACGQWRDLPGWPPPATEQAWYPGEDGTPGRAEPARDAVSALRCDPDAPAPSVGGQEASSNLAGRARNNALEDRPDVLVFTSPPLDTAMTVTGPVTARLRVRGSTGNFDVFARLCDVDPRGRSWNDCDGLLRVAGADGETDARVAMSSAAYEFAAGHRLRLQVAGGAHPRFARNLGTGEPFATATTMLPVRTQLRHGPGSALLLPVSPPPAGTGGR
jgi:putative CocE/NonD family hydrolase